MECTPLPSFLSLVPGTGGTAILSNNRPLELADAGDIWTNIWMGDPTYFAYSGLAQNGYNLSSGVVGGIVIDNNATQFRVKNNSGPIVYGPAGEGVAPPNGTNSREVFELGGQPPRESCDSPRSTCRRRGIGLHPDARRSR